MLVRTVTMNQRTTNHPRNFSFFSTPWGWCFVLIWVFAGNLQAQSSRRVATEDDRTTFFDSLQPTSTGGGPEVLHLNYTAYHSAFGPGYQQPLWVAYRLNRAHVGGGAERSSGFWNDPRLKGHDASDEDYRGSGMDRGHLVPAADMAWSARTMHESFSYANVSPQRPGLIEGFGNVLKAR